MIWDEGPEERAKFEREKRHERDRQAAEQARKAAASGDQSTGGC